MIRLWLHGFVFYQAQSTRQARLKPTFLLPKYIGVSFCRLLTDAAVLCYVDLKEAQLKNISSQN